MEDLSKLGLWTLEMIQSIILNNGSIQHIKVNGIHEKRVEHIKEKYLTAYELPQQLLLEMAANRGVYICQSTSQNVFMPNPTVRKLGAYLMAAYNKGLKTGMYYLRQHALTSPANIALKGKTSPATPLIVFDKIAEKSVCTAEVCTTCTT